MRIVAFIAGLGILFGIAFGAGRLFDDDDQGAYTLRAELDPEFRDLLYLTIFDGDGHVVLGYETRHEKQLHLIAVRKDFGGYHHFHPSLDSSGGWTLEDAAFKPGDWRLYADFQPEGGEPEVATTDLVVSGSATKVGPSEVDRVAVVDGYTVEAIGDLIAGSAAELRFRVSRNGEPVTDLQPYLGAFGHLVVLRDSDLDYLHAHPGDGPAGPEIPFHVETQTAGRYHLFLDFKHDDVVRTAAFVLEAGAVESDDMGGMDHGGH